MAATAQDPSAPLRGAEKLKDEDFDETEWSPFYGIDKGAVLQEARIFHEQQIDPRRCQQVITKLLYLLHQGETFTKKEASEVFFAVTKLFQNKDANLRRMIYLCIRDICPTADEVIIVVSSLMKDMNSKVDLYRSNSIRVLCRIIDSQLLMQVERYIKQAVVDKSPVVASGALLSGMHLMKQSPDIVKRWSSEIQEATTSKNASVQFHAVSLLHAIRATDRLAVSKLVTSLTKVTIRSPLAQCMLIRYVSQVIADSSPGTDGNPRPFYDFLESCLRHKSEMVVFQAARAITELKGVTIRELTPAVTVLQLYLSSSRPVTRFAAVRLLNKVAMTHPMAVTNCNIDMEGLISDANRSIATLAITTLLKTGNEGSVDRLLKQIGSFMSDIADDFKIVVVQAIRTLCLKFPTKHRALMNFLSSILREEGGFEYKRAIVSSVVALIQDIPEAKEAGLAHLCEFVEDCEFTYLSTQILHLLGEEGPKTSEPSKYIRYIYNRIILENATVRAAAVSSLASFGLTCPELRERVTVLLRRAHNDNDDEVRDRATLYLQQLDDLGRGEEAAVATGGLNGFDIPLENLKDALQEYLAAPETDLPFSLAAVPRQLPESAKPASQSQHGPAGKQQAAAAAAAATSEGQLLKSWAEELLALPEAAELGPLFKSCKPVQLTEEDTEYNVQCVKHVFDAHLVLQYNCTNTIQEQVLEDVSVMVDLAEAEGFEEEASLPLKTMPQTGYGTCYVILSRAPGDMTPAKFINILRFRVKEIDSASGEVEEIGYEDEYALEELELSAVDYIKPEATANFKRAWDGMDPATEMEDDYGLGEREGLQEAIEAVLGILGLQACEGTDCVPPNARSHTVLLSGSFLGDVPVVARVSFGIDASNVAMKLCVRAGSPEVSEAVHQIIQEA